MCGIVGIVSQKHDTLKDDMMKSLISLEYRGYDSYGVSFLSDSEFKVFKSVDGLSDLDVYLKKYDFYSKNAIGHTRWATHGEVDILNTHPFIGKNYAIALNGIVENHIEIRNFLVVNGYQFNTNNDTEVILNLIEFLSEAESDFILVLSKIINLAKGCFSFLVQSRLNDGVIYAVHNGSPMIAGFSNDFFMISSDINTCSMFCDKLFALKNKDICIISGNVPIVYNAFEKQNVSRETFLGKRNEISGISDIKKDYEYIMLKEIEEQPDCIMKNIDYYSHSQDLIDIEKLKNKQIIVIACGSSYYASLLAKSYLETMFHGETIDAHIATEIIYKNKKYFENKVLVFVSQSGETRDVINSFDIIGAFGATSIAIVNNVQSTLAIKCDYKFDIFAGPEYSVASTKAFTNQFVTLIHVLSKIKTSGYIFDQDIVVRIKSFLSFIELDDLCNCISQYNNIIIMGKDKLLPVAYEAALKIKELTYVNCQAISAGELKHGTLAVIDQESLVIALVSKYDIYIEKIISNIEEIITRKGNVIVVTDSDDQRLKFAKCIKYNIPDDNQFNPFYYIILMQYVAYKSSIIKGYNVDKPRNLAKSVTVD